MLTSSWNRPRLLMLAAVVLSALSQFMVYYEPDNQTTLMSYPGGLQSGTFSGGPLARGWATHPFACALLLALGLLFASRLTSHPLFQRFGWWAAATILLLLSAGAYRFAGPKIGLLAAALAFAAAAWNLQRPEAVADGRPHDPDDA